MVSTEVHIPLEEYVALTTAKQVPPTSNWSFTQGFVLGQVSVCLVIIIFIRFFIFGPSPPPSRPSRPTKPPHLKKKQSSLLRSTPPQTISTILSKTYYNVSSHQPESLDWFNVLLAQTLGQFRDDARNDDALLNSLKTVLNGPKKPSFLDEIVISEVALGEEFPIFSNCRILPSPDAPTTKLQARMDVDLNDVLTLGIETKLLLNWPTPTVAVLPVALSVSILRFSGTLQIAFVPAAENAGKATTLAFSFLDDYRLEIGVRSLLGSRSRLTDVPKIAQLVESRLYQWIDERCVEPRFQQIVLPSVWPRKKTTREPGREGDVGTGVGVGEEAAGGGQEDEGIRRRRTGI
ncbi:hypothetical protein EX30DRAFT_316332 [Ascodesmis nigricans]|uniref:Maintenance of mitochondrial morphology protein 1 n=1 Tax=Ascodesmis nigricans TaxID=341454 RepID=A0A4S2N5A9_9PEZI|nr:hypothetical protein EX30DRAFT_316332 [Ascodesmis nigricans]